MNPANTTNARQARRTRHGFRWTLAPLLLLGAGLGTLSLGCSSTPSRATCAVEVPTDSDLALAPATTPDAPDPAPPAAPAAPVTPAKTYPDVQSAIEGVRTAATANEAVAAYTAGLALDRDNVTLQEAYVRRLVELNAPQLAEPVARRLVAVRPDDSLAWAVVAFSEAKRGNMVDALTDIAVSARKGSDDPFVQRTTGEMLAWYDNVPNRPALPAGIAADLDAARKALANQPTFSGAYAKADAFYKNPPRPDGVAAGQAGQPGQGGVASNAGAPPTQPAPAYPPDTAYGAYGPAVAPTYVAPEYVEPYVPYVETYVSPAYGYYPYYPAWEPGWGWGFGGSLLFIGGDWGWCGHGGWHHHWDGFGGRGFGHDNRSFAGRGTAGLGAGRGGLASGGRNAVSPRSSFGAGAVGANGLARSARSSGSAGHVASPRYASPGLSYSSRLATPHLGTAAPRYAPLRGSYNYSRAAAPRYSAPSMRSFGSFRGGSFHSGGSIRGGGSFHGGGHGGGHR